MSGVADYIYHLQQYEEYAFTWEELKKETGKTDSALRNELTRLVSKNEIITLRHGFYLIMPPRYRQYGKIPIEMYVDKLFNYLKKPYYLAFYTAAGLQGASHQKVQKDYVLTEIPNLRDIKKGSINIKIFATSKWPEKNIFQRKSETGYFKVSSPALTMADLIHYQTKVGGINRILTVIEELKEEIDSNDIRDLVSWYPHISTLQRIGFLLEYLSAERALIAIIEEFLIKQKYYPILLSPETGRKSGRGENRWKVNMNVKPETDL